MKPALPLLALLALFALPLVAAAPLQLLCGDECRIVARSAGYDPLVATIASGSSVVWHAEDITHVQRDQNVGAGAAACFEAYSEQGQDTPAVRFDLAGTQLLATVDGITTPCASAVVTPTAAVLPYFCSIHPTMRAALVVTAG